MIRKNWKDIPKNELNEDEIVLSEESAKKQYHSLSMSLLELKRVCDEKQGIKRK